MWVAIKSFLTNSLVCLFDASTWAQRIPLQKLHSPSYIMILWDFCCYGAATEEQRKQEKLVIHFRLRKNQNLK